jgi:hypothetical protein
MTASTVHRSQYSLEVIQEEVQCLVHQGIVSRQQPIYTLCQYIPARDWMAFECELEQCEFLLRDRIGDLLGREDWTSD